MWDHTAVGPQTVGWSLGGAVAEQWRPGASVDDLLLVLGGCWTVPERRSDLGPILAGFAAAYAAFRMGLADLCAHTCGDPAEVASAAADHERYVGVLRALAGAVRR